MTGKFVFIVEYPSGGVSAHTTLASAESELRNDGFSIFPDRAATEAEPSSKVQVALFPPKPHPVDRAYGTITRVPLLDLVAEK